MFAPALDRLSYRYPAVLVDAVLSHEPGVRMVAVKNVTVNEEFFQGHFPGTPLMPGVLLIESLAQVASLLLGGQSERITLRGVDNVKFRRQVVPGDRLELDVKVGARRGPLVRAEAIATSNGQVVAEAELVLVLEPGDTAPERNASRSSRAKLDGRTAELPNRTELGQLG
jgi:3-hydroxyacyl-[acyl-carrier-protein] dehydratase